LIYLDRAARNQVIEALDQALAPSGLLFVGAVETSQITAKHYTSIRHPFLVLADFVVYWIPGLCPFMEEAINKLCNQLS